MVAGGFGKTKVETGLQQKTHPLIAYNHPSVTRQEQTVLACWRKEMTLVVVADGAVGADEEEPIAPYMGIPL